MDHSSKQIRVFFTTALLFLFLSVCVISASAAAVVTGELKKWHRVTITFDGPAASESDTATFLNNRLNVTFTNGSKSYTVPGFFAADGNAAVSGATSGDKWRVYFCPDETGTWTYTASFRTGADISIDPSAAAGTADATLDGATGTFDIGATDKTGSDFRGKGMLKYVYKHYLQFAETGEYFIKGGSNSPDNFFAYADFDNTPAAHSYTPHVADAAAGDSLWNGKGKGILGAINYLSSVGLNSQCVRVLNRPGETGDVFPYVDSGSAPWDQPAVLKTFDCSKLDQWEIVFEHMTKKGILIHLSLAQVDNGSCFEFAEGLMSEAAPFALTRKLFYREMIARFGHHCALVWNVVEQTDLNHFDGADQSKSPSGKQMIDFCAYIRSADPYQHLTVAGTETHDFNPIYIPELYLDTGGSVGGISVINDMHSAYEYPIMYWNKRASKPFICFQDQVYGGVPLITDQAKLDSVAAYWGIDMMWPHLLSGGSGIEYSVANQGRTLENFRDYEPLWKQVAIATGFMNSIPFYLMGPPNGTALTSSETRYPYLQLGKDSLFIVKINSNFVKFFDMRTITPGTKFSIKWFVPRTGVYAKGPKTIDTAVVSDIEWDQWHTSFGLPPGVTDWANVDYSIQWICILRNTTYPDAVINKFKARGNSPGLHITGSRVLFFSAANEHVTITLTAVDGATVKTLYNGTMRAGAHTISLQPENLANGAYFIIMRQGSRQYVAQYIQIK